MNPAILNYLQNSQVSNPISGTQQQEQAPYNPFDSGIQKAIASARMSLGMTKEQDGNALRNSMLTFADNMSQQPRQKGFLNNFASFGRALSPAIRAHDEAENTALTQNNALANQILAYKAAEEQRAAQEEERNWHRKHAENQLGEQRRYHNMMNQRTPHGISQDKKTAEEQRLESSDSGLSNIFNNAEKILKSDLQKQETYRGRFSNLMSRFTPGGYIPTEKQAEVNALGDVLRGNLFRRWGYRNQAEFERVPSISADNPPEVNLQIIETLKELLGKVNTQMENSQIQGLQDLDQTIVPQEEANIQSVLMQDEEGNQYMIPANQVNGAINKGLLPIEE